MFITRKKLNKIIEDKVAEILVKNKWEDFCKAVKAGDIVKYQELEWEVTSVKADVGIIFGLEPECIVLQEKNLRLAISGQTKTLKINRQQILDIRFVMEDE